MLNLISQHGVPHFSTRCAPRARSKQSKHDGQRSSCSFDEAELTKIVPAPEERPVDKSEICYGLACTLRRAHFCVIVMWQASSGKYACADGDAQDHKCYVATDSDGDLK